MEQDKWYNWVMMAWNTHFKDTGLYTIFPWWEALIWNLWPHQKHLEIPHLQNPSYRPGYCWGSHCHHHPKKETIQWGWSKKEYVQSSCLSLLAYMVSNVPAKIVLSLWPISQNTTKKVSRPFPFFQSYTCLNNHPSSLTHQTLLSFMVGHIF